MTVGDLIEQLMNWPDDAEIDIIFERLVGDDVQEAGPFTIDNVDYDGERLEIRCQER